GLDDRFHGIGGKHLDIDGRDGLRLDVLHRCPPDRPRGCAAWMAHYGMLETWPPFRSCATDSGRHVRTTSTHGTAAGHTFAHEGATEAPRHESRVMTRVQRNESSDTRTLVSVDRPKCR